MKLLVLYEELSEYFLSCLHHFQEKYQVEINIICKRPNKNAPFIFSKLNNIHFDDRSNFTTDELYAKINQINPDIVFCGGWAYKPYLSVSKKLRKSIPVILAFDNKWKNSFRQMVMSIISKSYFRKRFSCCWVPGNSQKIFAEKLGFSDNNIYLNAYSADVNKFHSIYGRICLKKKNQFPKKFIYVGRYDTSKGILDLWKAFIEIQNESPNQWELLCLGTGEIQPIKYPKISHAGFVQPKDMERYITEAGVFILPSHFEPWGVAVHEFAAAGFPLILSDEVGANEKFIEDGLNGFIFKAGNIPELKKCMQKIMLLSDNELFLMGERSVELSKKNTPDMWADILHSICKRYKHND